jgi:hypothetical protein
MLSDDMKGQSIIELIIGIAIGAIFIVGSATVIAPSLQINKQTTIVQTKTELASELMNNVKAWAGGNWNNVLALATGTANTYYLNTAVSPFVASSSVESLGELTGTASLTYTRYFYLSDVYRDGNGNVTTTAVGNYYDPSTKLVTVVVQASSSPITSPLILNEYLTRNGSSNFTQTSWVGGAGQNNPVTIPSSTFAASADITITASGSIQLSGGSASCVL